MEKRVCKKSVKELYDSYKRRTGRKISLSKFRKMHPKRSLTVDRHNIQYCLCQYCINIEFVLRTLQVVANTNRIPFSQNTKYKIAEATVCTNLPKCLEGNCDQCGTEILTDKLLAQFRDVLDSTVSWKKWRSGQTKQGERKHKVLVEEKGTLRMCVENLCRQAGTFAQHLFTATWQTDQFN